MAEPYFRPLTGSPVDSRAAQMHDAAEASAVAVAEEAAFLRSLGKPRAAQSELTQLKAAELAPDFAQRVANLDEEILRRGIAVDKERLLSLGRERFEQLLAADAKIPRSSLGSNVDGTSWQSVQASLHAFESPNVPRRTTLEQVAGDGKEREQVRLIKGFGDLWKASHERDETLRDIYAFRDGFESLILGQSILERLSKDGRLRSRLMCGGKGRRVEFLLRDWLGALQGSLSSVKLVEPLWHVVSWLANEKNEPPSFTELLRDWYGVRVPSKAQLAIARAVTDGFLLGLREWDLWQHVGRATRTAVDEMRLSSWRKELTARCPRISGWHEQLRVAFYRDIDAGDVRYAHREVDVRAHRAFVERIVQERLDVLSAVLALAVEAAFSGSVIARFEGQVLCDAKVKQRAEITAEFEKVFPRLNVELQFERLQS